jgi:hypothetical protein
VAFSNVVGGSDRLSGDWTVLVAGEHGWDRLTRRFADVLGLSAPGAARS